MSTLRNISMSFIEYRPSLFGKAPVVPLGIVASAPLGRLQCVVLTVRRELSAEQLGMLDPIARELLAKPAEFLSEQLRKAIAGMKTPDQALANFSAANQWSVFVSAPRPRVLNSHLFDFSKARTLRRVVREAYELHQQGMDPYATTSHRTPKPGVEVGAPAMQFQRLDPARHVWESRGGMMVAAGR